MEKEIVAAPIVITEKRKELASPFKGQRWP